MQPIQEIRFGQHFEWNHSNRESHTTEVSVVMPCLNEADTLATCIEKAWRALDEHDISGEVIVADNGSTDGSQDIALRLGARVVPVQHKGYGSALMGGIAAARGRYIIMGDADDSYDFLELPKFVDKLRKGYDLVQGCRLPRGGGHVASGAMPFLHRWWGNPMFSAMARWWFKVPIHDIYCGMRGFTAALYKRLNQRCTGMEFATEMIIKSSLYGEKIAEVPITLHPDGRESHPPHLRTFRDGWRTLRFFLMHSPRWLFVVPSLVLMLLGIVGYAIALPGLTVAGVSFDVHTLLFASLALLVGFQGLAFSVLAKTFAVHEGLMPPHLGLERFFRIATLERGLGLTLVTLCAGFVLLALAFAEWESVNFGDLDYASTMRLVIPGATLTALSIQALFTSFLVSLMGLRRTRPSHKANPHSSRSKSAGFAAAS